MKGEVKLITCETVVQANLTGDKTQVSQEKYNSHNFINKTGYVLKLKKVNKISNRTSILYVFVVSEGKTNRFKLLSLL